MAKDKKSVLIYVDWISIFDELSDEEAGKLIKHLFRYVNDKNPEAPDRLTKLLFEPIKQTLKRDLVKYEQIREKNRDNVLKRWNKSDTTEYDRIKEDTKHTDIVIDSDTVIDKDKESVINYTEVVENYHLYCDRMAKVSKLSDARKKHISARYKEFDYNTMIEVIKRAGKSDFLCGKNDKSWKADFDWIFNPTNFLKIMEGKYDNKEAQKPKFVF